MLKTRFVLLGAATILFTPYLAQAFAIRVPSAGRAVALQPQGRQGTTSAPGKGGPLPAQPSTDKLLQLHLAEYQVLSARSTNWITLQYGLAAFTVAALGVIIANWGRLFSSDVGTWVIAILYQFIMVAHLLVLSELFNNVRYMECELRPAVKQLVSQATDVAQTGKVEELRFWRYQQYMASHSAYRPAAVYLLPLQAIAAMLAAIWFRHKTWAGIDWFGGAGSLLVAIVSVVLALSVVAINKEFLVCAAK